MHSPGTMVSLRQAHFPKECKAIGVKKAKNIPNAWAAGTHRGVFMLHRVPGSWIPANHGQLNAHKVDLNPSRFCGAHAIPTLTDKSKFVKGKGKVGKSRPEGLKWVALSRMNPPSFCVFLAEREWALERPAGQTDPTVQD